MADRFQEVYRSHGDPDQRIFVDTHTAVQYLYMGRDRAYGSGSALCPLLDQDGKPLLYEG